MMTKPMTPTPTEFPNLLRSTPISKIHFTPLKTLLLQEQRSSTAMADPCSDLLHNLDTLWFHRSILRHDPISKTTQTAKPISETPTKPQFLILPTPLSEENTVKDHPQAVHNEQLDFRKESSPRLNQVPIDQEHQFQVQSAGSKTHSCSSSPTAKRLPQSRGSKKEGKIWSCKSLSELEYYEVKGFMDLGFTFNKEELSPRMISMIPGLQRLGEKEATRVEDENGAIRPYLSEAWLIKRPDSPLLNLRLPQVSDTGADMKKHLRFWARTVASEVHQES